jgi:hypothetical protein
LIGAPSFVLAAVALRWRAGVTAAAVFAGTTVAAGATFAA